MAGLTKASSTWRSTKSVRVRTLLVVLLVVFALPVSVWLSRLTNPGWAAKLRWDIAEAATAAARVIGDDQQIDAIAANERAWIRVVKRDGTPVHSSDHTNRGGASKLFWGPEGPPTLRAFDDQLPPLIEREPVVAALAGEPSSGCALAGDDEMLLCTNVRTAGDYVIYVQKSSFGAIRSLYDVRFEIGALTLNLLVVGVLGGLWLGWRIVAPVENLRRQVLARTTGPLSTKPLEVRRKDEFGDLGRAFNELLAALEARNKANEVFAADLAHELKNPTAAIKAATEALERGPGDQQRIDRLIRIFRNSSERLETVVGQYLELARAEAGLSLEERSDVRLDELVRGVTSIVEQDQRFAEVTFTVEASETTLPVAAERLETALRNLINNAATYAGEGGQVEVRVEDGQKEVLVSVTDSGPGISAEDLPHVFARFFSRRPGGTGLGLPLSKAVIEAHGGTLSVESTPGEGAVFTATFPRPEKNL